MRRTLFFIKSLILFSRPNYAPETTPYGTLRTALSPDCKCRQVSMGLVVGKVEKDSQDAIERSAEPVRNNDYYNFKLKSLEICSNCDPADRDIM